MKAMNLQSVLTNRKAQRAMRSCGIATLTGALMSSRAFAQFSSVTTTMTTVQTVLTGIAVSALTIAIMWAGFQIMFQHKKLAEVAHVLIGGCLVGGAAGIAAVIIS